MQKNAAVLTAICLLLCLSFNYTFPLHRGKKKILHENNNTSTGGLKLEHGGFVIQTKKIATNIEDALRKMVEVVPDGLTKASKLTHSRHAAVDGDLSNYEQLVFMKKYPFLDLKDLDINYRPPQNKLSRQSLNSLRNLGEDPSFCESADYGPKVEITNRGLSGFAIPMKLLKTPVILKDNADKTEKQTLHVLESLEHDIQQFQKHFGNSYD